MFNFVRADFYKNLKAKSIYAIFIIAAATAAIIAYVSRQIASGDMQADMGVNVSLMSDTILTAIFGGVIAGELIVDDFESKSVHNEIISGKGRMSIVLGKLISFACLFAITILPYAIITIIAVLTGSTFAPLRGIPSPFFDLLSAASGSDSVSSGKVILLCAVIIFMYIARLSICIPVAFKVRKKIPVLVTGFSTAFIFDVIFSLVKNTSGAVDFVKALPYYRTTTLTADVSSENIVYAVVSGAVYILVMVLLTHLFFKKGEIK